MLCSGGGCVPHCTRPQPSQALFHGCASLRGLGARHHLQVGWVDGQAAGRASLQPGKII